MRYGSHDKKVTKGKTGGIALGRKTSSILPRQETASRKIDGIIENITEGESPIRPGAGKKGSEVIPPWLGGKRKPGTVKQLMEILNIPESELPQVKKLILTGSEDFTFLTGDIQKVKSRRKSVEGDSDMETLQPSALLSDCDLISEVEEGGGLELPVRIDFSLQEELSERYISQIGIIQSHFNYWVSRDAAFFMLKQITNFRPRVCYPDFLRISEYSEKMLQRQTSAAPTNVMNVTIAAASSEPVLSSEPDEEEQALVSDSLALPKQKGKTGTEKVGMKRLPTRTIKLRESKPQDTENAVPAGTAGGAESNGKQLGFFLG